MALAADQQAMLQLLLERGQSYADLASVLGVDEAEVRSKARAALAELAGADPDRNVGLTDYLLGQADPIGRADAVRHLKDDPADLELATQLSQKLLLVAPQAELPRLPGEERRPRPRRSARTSPRLSIAGRLRRKPATGQLSEGAEARPRTTLTRRQTQLTVVFGCAAVLVVVALLAVTGAFSGGSSDANTTTAAPGSQKLATVALEPPRGGNASGSAVFGTVNGTLYADLTLNGLRPAPKGQAYVAWLMLTPSEGFPIPTVLDVRQNGSFQDRITIPNEVLAIAQRAQLLDISLVSASAIQSAIRSALNQQRLVNDPGAVVLRGNIPASRARSGRDGRNG